MRETHGPEGAERSALAVDLHRVDDAWSGGGREAPPLAAFVAAWPTRAVDNAEMVAEAWAGLSFDQRQAAIDGIPAFLAEMAALKRDRLPSGDRYLRERRWTLLSDTSRAKARSAASTTTTPVPAWSKLWWGVFWHRKATRAPVRFMWDRACQQSAFGATPAELAAAQGMTLVECTLGTADARAVLNRLKKDGMHHPFGRGDEKRVMFFPAGGA